MRFEIISYEKSQRLIIKFTKFLKNWNSLFYQSSKWRAVTHTIIKGSTASTSKWASRSQSSICLFSQVVTFKSTQLWSRQISKLNIISIWMWWISTNRISRIKAVGFSVAIASNRYRRGIDWASWKPQGKTVYRRKCRSSHLCQVLRRVSSTFQAPMRQLSNQLPVCPPKKIKISEIAICWTRTTVAISMTKKQAGQIWTWKWRSSRFLAMRMLRIRKIRAGGPVFSRRVWPIAQWTRG